MQWWLKFLFFPRSVSSFFSLYVYAQEWNIHNKKRCVTGSRCHSSYYVFFLSFLRCLCSFYSYSRVEIEGDKKLPISFYRERRGKRETKKSAIGLCWWLVRNWSYCAIFGQIIRRERKRQTSIARDFPFFSSKHLLTFIYSKRRSSRRSRKKKKRNLSITCLVFLFHKRGDR